MLTEITVRCTNGIKESMIELVPAFERAHDVRIAVTFGSTYALGHVAKQYYAQGRSLSAADLKQLFARFQEEAKTLFPKLQQQVQAQAKSLNLESLLSSLR